jgi:hypothetical protein
MGPELLFCPYLLVRLLCAQDKQAERFLNSKPLIKEER